MPMLLWATGLLVACTPEVPEIWSNCDARDPVTVTGARQESDTLAVDVSYGGGCETHQFSMCWPDRVFLESDPVQVPVVIWHDDGGDTCEAAISQTLQFDLRPLYTAFDDAYGAPGQVVVGLDGASVTVDVPASP